jgi:hypothetical protein
MEQMNQDLAALGHDTNFAAINIQGAESTQDNLVSKATYPLFQDTAAVDAWALHGGSKDDLYIYAPDGTLFAYLPYGGDVDTNLSNPTTYAAILDLVIAAGE